MRAGSVNGVQLSHAGSVAANRSGASGSTDEKAIQNSPIIIIRPATVQNAWRFLR